MLRRNLHISHLTAVSSSSLLTTAVSTLILSSSLRSTATRSGPRAFKTDRQRRRVMRDQSMLDNLPFTEYELERRSRRFGSVRDAPSSTFSAEQIEEEFLERSGASDEDQLIQTDKERVPRPGRNVQVEHALNEMRNILSAGPKATQHSGQLITAAIDRKRKKVHTRQPLSRMISAQQKQQQNPEEEKEVESQDQELEKTAKMEKEKGEDANNNNNSSSDDTTEVVWDPAKIKKENLVVGAASNNKSLTAFSSSPEENEIFISLQNQDSAVINDIGSDKLDELELARSSDLAKRIREAKPLPVFAEDDESVQQYLSSSSEEQQQQTEVTLKEAVNRARTARLEQLSKEFHEKYDGEGEFSEKDRFKKTAETAKEKLKNSSMGGYVALDYRGDELAELKILAEQVDQIHRHNALVKKTNRKLRQLIMSEKKQEEETTTEQQQNHFDESKYELESTTANLEQNSNIENTKNTSAQQQQQQQYTRPKAEKIDIQARDFLEDRSNNAKRQTRVRFPNSELIQKQHSPSVRGQSELASMAQLLPIKRFSGDDLIDDETPIVQQRGEIAELVEELHDDEKQTMSPLDTYVDTNFEKDIRDGFLRYYQRYPINHMIKCTTVIIGGIQDDKGHVHKIDVSERPRVSLVKARAMAAEHGKDLVQVTVVEVAKHQALPGGGKGGIALCYICDHFSSAMDEIRWHIREKNGNVTPNVLKPLLEVGFRGVTHDFAIRFKSIYVAKFLFKKFPVRISLTKFGGPREGFPIMERVLEFIKVECEKMKAYFVAGQIRYDQASIWVYLHPSTPKLPLTSIEAPSSEQLKETLERALFDAEYDREVTIPMSFTKSQAQAANRYNKELDEGTAWAWRSEGLTLADQRRIKIHQGLLPRGNKKLYSLRGDVDMKSPFKTDSTGALDKISFPRESNIDQAERGAGVLARRAIMTVSETHDKNEMPSQTHTLGDWDVMVTGDVFEAGAIKEALNIKRNRKKVPKFAPGFATMGVKDDDGVYGNEIQQF